MQQDTWLGKYLLAQITKATDAKIDTTAETYDRILNECEMKGKNDEVSVKRM